MTGEQLWSFHEYPFLRRVRAGWRVVPFRRLFMESREINGERPVGPMLSVSGYRGVEEKTYDSENRRRSAEEVSSYRVVRPGQLAVNTMWLNHAGLGVSDLTGHMSPAYRAYEISEDLNPRYVHYLMRSSDWVQGYTARATGVRPNSLQLSRHDLMTFPVLVPPMGEQRAIADYLDHETAEIDAFIKDEQQIAALLEERELAQLERLVSPEDVAWAPLKRLGLNKAGGYSANGAAFPAQVSETGVLKTGAVSRGVFDPSENKLVDDPAEQAKLVTPVRRGTAIVNRANTPHLVGSLVAVPEDHPNLFLSDLLWEVNVRGMKAEMLAHFSRTKRYREFVELISVGASSTMKKIRFEDFARLEVPLFSPERESAVLERLDAATESLRATLDDSHMAVALAKERRSALISAAVTGQIDVSKRMRPKAEQIEDEVREKR